MLAEGPAFSHCRDSTGLREKVHFPVAASKETGAAPVCRLERQLLQAEIVLLMYLEECKQKQSKEEFRRCAPRKQNQISHASVLGARAPVRRLESILSLNSPYPTVSFR
jgi:hypothetical protein